MDNFLQQLINGLTLGSIYGLIAIGYTMVFGIIGMVNFAHGDVFMLSAFIALIIFMILTQILHLGSLPVAFVVVLVGAMALTGLWNWAIERLAYRPLRGSFRLAPLISAIGMSIFLSNFVQVVQGPRNKPAPQLPNHVFNVTGGTSPCRCARSSSWWSPPFCWRPSGTSFNSRRSGGRSAPASRIARWRRCSGSTSTRRFRSPS